MGYRLLAFQGDQACRGVVQNQFRRPAAILGDIPTCGHAACAFDNQEQSQGPVGHGRHQPRVGLVARWYHALGARHRPGIACGFGLGLAGSGVVARFAFLVRQHHQGLATCNLGTPFGLQGRWRVVRQHRASDQGVRQGLEHDASSELFHHHHAFDRAHAQSAEFFGNVQTAQAKFG